ncbi:MAG: heavy metal-binding domain-containing protein [Pseudomonadota bacterium]
MGHLEFVAFTITIFGLFFLCMFIGKLREIRHLKKLQAREKQLAHMRVTDIRSFGSEETETTPEPKLVLGEVVIASDYWKNIIAGLRKFVGGEVRSYSSMMIRARREAILRMMERAHAEGYNAICNVRVQSSDIGGNTGRQGRTMPMAAMTAYGTAFCFAKKKP